VEGDDFGDRRQLFIESGNGEADARLGNFSLEQGAQAEGQDAVKGVDPYLLVGPVEGWREADPVRILHLFERISYMRLGPTPENDFLRCPVVVVGAKKLSRN
jgi:hypothetical protein